MGSSVIMTQALTLRLVERPRLTLKASSVIALAVMLLPALLDASMVAFPELLSLQDNPGQEPRMIVASGVDAFLASRTSGPAASLPFIGALVAFVHTTTTSLRQFLSGRLPR